MLHPLDLKECRAVEWGLGGGGGFRSFMAQEPARSEIRGLCVRHRVRGYERAAFLASVRCHPPPILAVGASFP